MGRKVKGMQRVGGSASRAAARLKKEQRQRKVHGARGAAAAAKAAYGGTRVLSTDDRDRVAAHDPADARGLLDLLKVAPSGKVRLRGCSLPLAGTTSSESLGGGSHSGAGAWRPTA
eukprot:TRINITY_DN9460_c0_g1_i2.p1 TRINITY_DN9460_c0_g1~~TRINITY_DN9460_c0_g1_i2.p1  ORF type:complete len:116 (+),score=2.19 TRINITY_DN9460_c0_g1_i2:89-436(+)